MAWVSFDPALITPLPKILLGSVCSQCDKTQAVWSLRRAYGDKPFVCSLCVLYESSWGRAKKEALDAFIAEVEKTKTPFVREPNGHLTCSDADRVMFAIVLSNKMDSLRSKIDKTK